MTAGHLARDHAAEAPSDQGDRRACLVEEGEHALGHTIDVATRILRLCGRDETGIVLVKDRPGHDRRYALDSTKARAELGWTPQVPFETGLKETVDWYRANAGWVSRVKSGEYRSYYEKHYGVKMAPAPRESTPIRRVRK